MVESPQYKGVADLCHLLSPLSFLYFIHTCIRDAFFMRLSTRPVPRMAALAAV